MKFVPGKRFFKVVGGICLTIALVLLAHNLMTGWALERELDAMRERGYPVTLAELEVTWVLPEGEENAFDAYREAFDLLDLSSPDTDDLPVIGSAEIGDDGSLDPETLEKTRAFLEANSAGLQRLHEATTMSTYVPPAGVQERDDWFSQLAERTSNWRNAGRLFSMQTLNALAAGDDGAAVNAVTGATGLANITEPFLIGYLIEVAVLGIVWGSLHYTLQSGDLTESDLLRLEDSFQGVLADVGSSENLNRVLMSEVCYGDYYAANFGFKSEMEDYHEPQFPVLMSGNEEIEGSLLKAQLALRESYFKFRGYFYAFAGFQTRARLIDIRNARAFLDLAELPPRELLEAVNTLTWEEERGIVNWLFEKTADYESLTRPDSMISAHVQFTTMYELALTAIAIEHFRLQHGRLPLKLDELAPEFLEMVPDDPFSDRKIRYRVEEEGYQLYSVGRNGIDEDGRRPFDDDEFGDDIAFRVH